MARSPKHSPERFDGICAIHHHSTGLEGFVKFATRHWVFPLDEYQKNLRYDVHWLGVINDPFSGRLTSKMEIG